MTRPLSAFVADARRAFGEGDEEAALALMERATTAHAEDPEAWHQRATVLSIVGRLDEAVACATRSCELAPGDTNGWYTLGRLHQDAGRLADAALAYGRSAAADPKHVDAWVNWGCVLDDGGDPEAAIERYDRAIALNDAEEMAWGNRGNSLLRLGRVEDALASYERAIDLGSESVAPSRCECLLALGRVKEANAARPSAGDPGEARERRARVPGAERDVVARYFIGRHSHPEMLDEAVERLVEHVAGLAGVPPGLGDGIRVAYGWPVLTIRERGPDLVLCDPDWFGDPTGALLREHVSFSAMHLVMTSIVLRVTELEPEDCFCHDTIELADGAIGATDIVMERRPTETLGHSGWAIHAADQRGAPTVGIPMSRIAAARAHLLKVVALPTGSVVTFRDHAVVSVRGPDGDERFA